MLLHMLYLRNILTIKNRITCRFSNAQRQYSIFQISPLFVFSKHMLWWCELYPRGPNGKARPVSLTSGYRTKNLRQMRTMNLAITATRIVVLALLSCPGKGDGLVHRARAVTAPRSSTPALISMESCLLL